MINLDSIKDHVIHIRDTDIWWGDEDDPYDLIRMAGGTIADEDNETLTVHTSHYSNVPSDENFVHEDDFWPECIKQAFPDYRERCPSEYFVLNKTNIFFDENSVKEFVERQWKDEGKYYEGFSLEYGEVTSYEHEMCNPIIIYTFWNEGGRATEGHFYAFQSEKDFQIFQQDYCHTSHFVVIQIQ